MSAWSLIAAESWAVKLHLFTVVPAFVIGTWMIFMSQKGSWLHRLLGALYMVLMLVTAGAAFFVRSGDPPRMSWIHLFIPLTVVSVAAALWAARRGNVTGHRNAMIGLYVGGLLIAGAFTFTPGRLMHRLIFG